MGLELNPLMLRSELPLMAAENSIIFNDTASRHLHLLVAGLAS